MARVITCVLGLLVGSSLWAGSITLEEAKAIRSLSIKPEIAANLKTSLEYLKKKYAIKVIVSNPLKSYKGKSRDKLIKKYATTKKVPIRITVSASQMADGQKARAYMLGKATIQVIRKEDKKSFIKISQSMSKLCPS